MKLLFILYICLYKLLPPSRILNHLLHKIKSAVNWDRRNYFISWLRDDIFFSNKIKILLVFCFILGLSGNLFSQIGFHDETVAEIEGEKITASLFQEVWEMNPHLNTGNKSNSLSEKINFLNTIVAYKLWYHNMDKYSVDTSSAYSTAVNEIEKMFEPLIVDLVRVAQNNCNSDKIKQECKASKS